MINQSDLKMCSGCGACANACPKKAIELFPDKSGFLYPTINKTTCVNCSLCNDVCQTEKNFTMPAYEQRFYGLVNKNKQHLKASSSGGAFLAMAKYAFDLGGVVVGCAFNDELRANHIVTHNLDECINKLCGSKYVQSETQYTYTDVKNLLHDGKFVLFVGTPCQIEGLLLFLKDKPKNLITVDLICHGVSSPLLWQKHKEYLESKVHSKINSYRFRGKEKNGWSCYYYYYYGDKNKCKYGSAILDHYYADFLSGSNYRESCYKCKYANLNRIGDITIGDCWGAENFIDGINLNEGISLIIINSKTGCDLIDKLKDSLILKKITKENATKYNHNLHTPTPRPLERDNYYEKCFRNFEKWEKEYTHSRDYIINKVKIATPNVVKKAIKKLLRR